MNIRNLWKNLRWPKAKAKTPDQRAVDSYDQIHDRRAIFTATLASVLAASTIGAQPANAALLPATFDVASSTVIAASTATARTLAARFADEVSIEDQGVVHDPTGIHVAANTAAYQALLNTYGGVARIRHRGGITVFVTNLLISNNGTILDLEGTLKLAPTTSAQYINAVIAIAASQVVINMNGVIDGNSANQNGIKNYAGTSSLFGAGGIVTVNQTAYTPPAVPYSDVYVVGTGTIQNIVYWPVSIGQVYRASVIGIRMIGAGSAPQFAGGTNKCLAAQLYVENTPDYGWAFYEGCFDGALIDSIFVNVATVGVLNDGGSEQVPSYNSQPQHDILIARNLIVGTTIWGLSVYNGSSFGSSANHYNIDLLDNKLVNCANANTANSAQVFLSNCSNIRVGRNTITGGGTAGVNNFGISAASTCSYVLVAENIIENMGKVGTGLGILLGCPHLCVRDNWVRDTQTTHTFQYGFFGTAGTATTVTNNRVQSMTATAYNVTWASDSQVEYWTGATKTVIGTLNVTGAANWLALAGSASGTAVTISTGGSDTNRSITISPAGTGNVDITSYLYVGGLLVAQSGITAQGNVNVSGANNNLSFAGSATGGATSIVTTGSDTAVPLSITPKGGGQVTITSTVIDLAGTTVYSSGLFVAQSGITSQGAVNVVGTNNTVTLTGSATGSAVSIAAFSGTNANVALSLASKGSGLLTIGQSAATLSFFGGTGTTKPIVTGSKAGNPAVASIAAALAALGLVTDSTT